MNPGNHSPSDTTYQQGWRCVEDTKLQETSSMGTAQKMGYRMVLTILALVMLPATGYASILGSNELLASTNNNKLRGFSDWEVPHLAQLLSIASTKAVEGSNSKMTLDTDGFKLLGTKARNTTNLISMMEPRFITGLVQ
ncbi:hypothetical protein O9993_15930 [Vibrio lentus]|nr:hypothetical protein [Vibrio lentus]